MGANDTHCYFGVRQTLEALVVFKRLLFYLYVINSITKFGNLQRFAAKNSPINVQALLYFIALLFALTRRFPGVVPLLI